MLYYPKLPSVEQCGWLQGGSTVCGVTTYPVGTPGWETAQTYRDPTPNIRQDPSQFGNTSLVGTSTYPNSIPISGNTCSDPTATPPPTASTTTIKPLEGSFSTENGVFSIKWLIEPSKNLATFNIVLEKVGYISIGLNRKPKMECTDVVFLGNIICNIKYVY
jgi:hypothetical protein